MSAATAPTAPRRRVEREAPEVAAGAARMIRAVGRRVSDDADNLVLLVELQATAEQALRDAALACHEAGWSWSEIADRLGVTRQAARQRFAR